LNEQAFIDQLKKLATHPAARGLVDDAAVLTIGRHKVVVTHDMLVENVHYLPETKGADVAWKLVAVNMSDLAAKGARPLGVILGYTLSGREGFEYSFLTGLNDALQYYQVPLIGGDTVKTRGRGAQCLGLTAIGETRGYLVPSRSDAKIGQEICVNGSIGDAWAGLLLAAGEVETPDLDAAANLLAAYHRPSPNIAHGQALATLVGAMTDISDGLLLDASRIADASKLAIVIELDRIPLSPAYQSLCGASLEARLAAAVGGDDYRLLYTTGANAVLPVPTSRIGYCKPGQGISLLFKGKPVPLPEKLGYWHG
jgi:thiamine-monophosphate kinase